MAYLTYPLNFIDYDANDAEAWLCTRGSGVFYAEDFGYSISGANTEMTIEEGLAWIHNHRWAGKVFKSDSAVNMTLSIADSLLDRVDVVAIQFSAVANETQIIVKTGTPASVPVMPAISQTEAVYELYLYSVYRKAGSVSITASDITDLRLSEYCGLMADSVTRIDTSAINAQVSELISELRAEIEAVRDGSEYMLATVYDPQGKKKDIFEALDILEDSINVASGAAATAQATANTAVTQAAAAQMTADAAMPKSGGTFMEQVFASNTNTSNGYGHVRNIRVTDSAGTNVSTGKILMARK